MADIFVVNASFPTIMRWNTEQHVNLSGHIGTTAGGGSSSWNHRRVDDDHSNWQGGDNAKNGSPSSVRTSWKRKDAEEPSKTDQEAYHRHHFEVGRETFLQRNEFDKCATRVVWLRMRKQSNKAYGRTLME